MSNVIDVLKDWLADEQIKAHSKDNVVRFMILEEVIAKLEELEKEKIE